MPPVASPAYAFGDPPSADREPGLRLMLILSALMSFASLSTDIYLPALPAIARDLHALHGSIELTLSSFLVGFSAGQLVWGPIADRRGRRLPIALGLCLFVVGSIGCATSTNIGHMLVWRAVQAAGASAGPVLARAMVRDLYARERGAHMLSTLILIMGVAPLVGPIVGGQILVYSSWRGIFWMLAVLGTITVLALRMLPETLPKHRRSTEPLSKVFAEYFDLLHHPRLVGYALAGGFFYAATYAYIIGTPFIYIDYFHISPQVYGWLFAVNIAGMMAANYLNARMLARVGSERMFHYGTWVVAASGMVLAVTAYTGFGGLLGITIPIFFLLSMNGLIVANSVAGALSDFPHRAGAASSLVGGMHYGSGIVSAALVGALADGTPWPMGAIIGVAGLGCVIAAAVSSHLHRRMG